MRCKSLHVTKALLEKKSLPCAHRYKQQLRRNEGNNSSLAGIDAPTHWEETKLKASWRFGFGVYCFGYGIIAALGCGYQGVQMRMYRSRRHGPDSGAWFRGLGHNHANEL